MPAYAALSLDVELGLESDVDGRSILAIQRWKSVEVHAFATTRPEYAHWWRDYAPTLGEWDRLVEFADEWSTTPLALRPR